MDTSQSERPELPLLFLASRPTADAATDRAIRAMLQRPIDWDVLFQKVAQHRVGSLVARTFARLQDARIPDDVVQRLRAQVRGSTRNNLRLTAELLQVVDLLAAHDVDVIPYKGPSLAISAYGDLSLRQFDDLDIIIRERDVAKTTEVLGARGYRLARDITGKDVALFHERLAVTLEVHWSITGDKHPIQVPPERLWENLGRTQIGGRSVLAHAPEDLLWILAIHGAQHRWDRLIWLCDVAEIIRREPLDWDKALATATELRVPRILLLGVMLARDLLGAPIPASVAEAIDADRTVETLAAWVKGWLASGGPGPEELGDAERYYVSLAEHMGDRVRIALKQTAPYLAPRPEEKAETSLPWYLAWVLYVVRPFRLARRYGLGPLRRILKGLFES